MKITHRAAFGPTPPWALEGTGPRSGLAGPGPWALGKKAPLAAGILKDAFPTPGQSWGPEVGLGHGRCALETHVLVQYRLHCTMVVPAAFGSSPGLLPRPAVLPARFLRRDGVQSPSSQRL